MTIRHYPSLPLRVAVRCLLLSHTHTFCVNHNKRMKKTTTQRTTRAKAHGQLIGRPLLRVGARFYLDFDGLGPVSLLTCFAHPIATFGSTSTAAAAFLRGVMDPLSCGLDGGRRGNSYSRYTSRYLRISDCVRFVRRERESRVTDTHASARDKKDATEGARSVMLASITRRNASISTTKGTSNPDPRVKVGQEPAGTTHKHVTP